VTQGDESEGSVELEEEEVEVEVEVEVEEEEEEVEEEEGEVVLAEKLLEKIGPPEERHRSCHCCAMSGRSACAILFP